MTNLCEDSEIPPTPVGGIQELGAALACRSDLNNPPTPVDGIWATAVCQVLN